MVATTIAAAAAAIAATTAAAPHADLVEADESGGDFAKILLCYLNTGMNMNTSNRRPPFFPRRHLGLI